MAKSSASITCPKCGMESHNPNDVRERYCGNCHQFHSALGGQEAICFNRIVADLKKGVKSRIDSGSPFTLQFEEFVDDGRKYWRALIRLGAGVWKHSHRPQATPQDALRELYEIMKAGL